MGLKLQDKVVLITGTSPNIGGGIATGLADEGAKVACVDIRAEYARQCAAHITQRGGEALPIVCDVTDEAQVQAAVQQAVDQYGGVDLLVNNAVIFNQKGVLDMPLAEWTQQLSVMLNGAFLCTKYVAQLMIEQGCRGSIVNIISTAGHQGEPWNVGYSTGKSGLLNFTRSVAMELAAYGIRVNSLTPTATDPAEGMTRAAAWNLAWPIPRSASPQRRGFPPEPNTGVPLHQWPSPRHYARAIAFLASDDAEMITGIDLRVDAGALARYWRWDPDA